MARHRCRRAIHSGDDPWALRRRARGRAPQAPRTHGDTSQPDGPRHTAGSSGRYWADDAPTPHPHGRPAWCR